MWTFKDGTIGDVLCRPGFGVRHPAKAGIYLHNPWIPAFAGMTMDPGLRRGDGMSGETASRPYASRPYDTVLTRKQCDIFGLHL